jgi:sec-independent protein translocase protein TatA
MVPYIQMPQGAEWLIILAIVVLLFGSAKLPALVKQLGKSKKIWEEEVGSSRKKDQLTEGTQAPTQQVNPQVQAPSQQAAQQPVQQPAQQPNQVNGQAPGDGVPPTHTAN